MFKEALRLHQKGQLPEAQALYQQILALQPDDFDALHMWGVLRYQMGDYAQAAALMQRAIEINPNHALVYVNCGAALRNLHQHQAAIAYYDRAIALRPTDVEVYNNRANAKRDLGQHTAAIDDCQRAIALAPEHADAHFNLALCYLQLGDFARGWPEYEWRWKKPDNAQFVRHFTQPLWLGKESLQGKTILLHSEQGLGDALQFCRYAKWVRAKGAHVVLQVPRPLIGVLSSLEGVDVLLALEDQLPPFDVHCPLLSLPLAFQTTLETIPADAAYVQSDAHKMAYWQERLGPKTKLRVGLVWSGRSIHKEDRNRSVLLADLMRDLPQAVQYISLQKELRAPDQVTLEQRTDILHFGPELKDFSDTAALCELVDLVVSVDTSVAHLAAAMGRRVWLLLPKNPDWRWLLDRTDSPWYPSACLYRQEKMGDWSQVLERVAADLRQELGSHSKVLLEQAAQLHREGRLDLAREIYENVLQWQPRNFDALHLLGVLAQQSGDSTRAIELLQQAIAIDPHQAKAYSHLGLAWADLKQYERALEHYDHALALEPGYVPAHFNRGAALQALGKSSQALASYDQILTMDLSNAQLRYNRGVVLNDLGQSTQALQSYQQAIVLDAKHVQAHWNLALCYLKQGDFERGWQAYEWRWQREETRPYRRSFSQPLWQGQPLGKGECLLVWGEQGLGDQILCLTLLHSLMEQVAHITLAVEPRLLVLVQRSFPQIKVIPLDAQLEQEPCTAQIPMMSLGQHLRKSWADFPVEPRRCLLADQLCRQQLRQQLKARKPWVCGISWISRNPAWIAHKSVSLQSLRPLLDLPDIQCVDLQYGDVTQELEALTQLGPVDVLRVPGVDNTMDLDALAALIDACDVVLTVSNTTAHLAAALGKPVYLILTRSNGLHWYWHEDRADSPWYPSVRLYRQTKPGDWDEVLARVLADVQRDAKRCHNSEPDDCVASEAVYDCDTAVRVQLRQGLALHQQGQFVQARQCYECVLQMQTDHVDARYLLGLMAYQRQQFEEALVWVRQALALNAQHSAAHHTLGLVFSALGQYTAALASYDQALALQPDYADAYANRGIALWKLKQYPAALQSYDRAIALDPANAQTHCNRGMALQVMGQYEQALASYEQALALKPRDVQAQTGRERVLALIR